MLAKCIGNSPRDLSDDRALAAYARDIHLEEVGLVVDREYVVYGIAFRSGDGVPWYLVCEEKDDEYPTPQLGSFFELEDASIPDGWEVGMKTNAGDFAILPSRWARDPTFLEKLVDGESEEIAYFRGLRAAYDDL